MKALKLLLVVLTLAATTIANAQWKKEFTQKEASLSYGYKSAITLIDAFGDVEMNDVTQSNITTDNRTSIGAINGQFLYRTKRIASYGFAFSYEQTNEDCLTGNKTKTKVGELKNHYYSFIVPLKLNWVEKKKFAFYSKLAIGMTFIGDKYTPTSTTSVDVQSEKQHYFGFQVAPAGFIFGKTICGFLELGYGTQGLLQAGVCYRY